MSAEAPEIAKCLLLAEEKLGWGNSADWQKQDFERVSEKIFENTQVMLSASTLKRIWGKTRYDSKPSLSTLNALAQFCGYENWRAFAAAQKTVAPALVQKSSLKKWWWMAGAVIVLVITSVTLYKKPVKKLQFKETLFSNQPVTVGLPNTVVFNYDASHSNADSVFIQQSWDTRRRFKVDKQLHEYASTYFIPGYYRAKLILDDSIVREQDVYIESQGWMRMVENRPIPVYLPKNIFSSGETMAITEKDLMDQKIDPAEPPMVSITKVDKTIDVASEHLSLIVALQNTSRQPNGICRQTGITLMGTNGLIFIPLCAVGCTGEIGLILGMQRIDGKTHNLSGFGVDFSKEAIVNCATGNGQIIISINNKQAYSGPLPQNIGRIAGTKITFRGTGVVHRFELK